MSRTPCIVCEQRPRTGLLFCEQCADAWDDDSERDNSFAAAVVWTATRVRAAKANRAAALEAALRAYHESVPRCWDCPTIATFWRTCHGSVEWYCEEHARLGPGGEVKFGVSEVDWADAARAAAAVLGGGEGV